MKKLGVLAFITVLVVLGAVWKSEKAAAAACTILNNPTNIFPRANLGSRENVGCTDADSFIWMSDYYTSPSGGSPLTTDLAQVRVFFKLSDIVSRPDPIDTIMLYSPDSSRVRCGFAMTVTYVQTGQNFTVEKNGSTCAWPTSLGFVHNSSAPGTVGAFDIYKSDLQSDPKYGSDVGFVDIIMDLTVVDTNAPFKVWATQSGSVAKISFREQDLAQAQSSNTFQTGSYDSSFAIWTNQIGPDPQEPISYTLNFMPDCTIAPEQDVQIYLKWYDADDTYPPINSATQPFPFQMYLVDDTTVTHVIPGGLSSDSYDFGGDDQYASYPVTIKGGHKYRWIWSGVARNNGVQIYMPFSEINSDASVVQCNPVAPSVDLKVNDLDGPVPVIQGIDNIIVTWAPTNVTSCTASRTPAGSGWNGARSPAGGSEDHTADTAVLGTFNYDINCNGPAGPASDRVVVNIRQNPNKPYFQVLNGDVSAGAGFGSSCSMARDAPIAGFNNGPSNYFGAGARLAAFDPGIVNGFTSAMANIAMTPRPRALTFANTGPAPYGGQFEPLVCAPDYYGAKPTLPNPGSWPGNFGTSGVFEAPGDITLSAASDISPGTQVTLYVDGDVYITSNLRFAGAGTLALPTTFYLIVRGNIFVNYQVTQLDGIYIAQPDSTGAEGKIYTCSVDGTPPDGQEVATNTLCGAQQLTVNGALLAKQVKLLRSRSKVENCTTLANCLDNSAEIINYTPDIWLGPKSELQNGSAPYDAITSLPPLL